MKGGDLSRLSTNFRFKNGNKGMDNRSIRDMDRMVDFLSRTNAGKVTLVGFADSRGAYQTNLKISCDRVNIVKNELRSRGIRTSQTACAGEEIPVASNETALGRAKNRRVEVWLK